MDITTLRFFVITGKLEHMSRAAEELGISEPALSRKIKALESEVGARLFQRVNRGIKLTSAGRLFLAHASEIVEASAQAVHLTRAAELGAAGPLHIGYTGSSLFDHCVSDTIKLYARQFPNVDLHMHEFPPMPLLHAMEAGQFQIAFVRGPIGVCPHSMRTKLFSQTSLVAVFNPDHPLAGVGDISFDKLVKEKFISFNDPNGVGLDSTLKALALEAGFEPDITTRVDSVAGIISLVMVGIGIGILPADMMGFEDTPACVVRKLAQTNVKTDIMLLQRKTSLSAVERGFLSWVDAAKHGKRTDDLELV